MKKNNLWQFLNNAILGKEDPATDSIKMDLKGVDMSTPEFKENMGGVPVEINVSNAPRLGGLIPDIRAGYRENAYNPISMDNLSQNILPDGRKKRTAYRFGEFAGTAARLLDNPLVRGAIAYGLSDRMGDRNPLVEGVAAAVGTQQNRMKDKMYRNELEKMGFDTNGITGFVGDDTFNKIFQSKQLQDNAEYRNALLKGQRLEQDALLAQKQAELQHKKMSEAADRALKSRELDIQEMKALNGNSKEEAKRKQSQSTLNMIGTALNTVDQNPEAYGFWKGMAPNDITNRADAKGVQARAVIDSVTAEYRKYLTGAQMSDKERKDYEKFLPNPRDNADIIRRKLLGMQTVIQAREGLYDYAPQAQTTQNISINNNALEAEMKRRGLK